MANRAPIRDPRLFQLLKQPGMSYRQAMGMLNEFDIKHTFPTTSQWQQLVGSGQEQIQNVGQNIVGRGPQVPYRPPSIPAAVTTIPYAAPAMPWAMPLAGAAGGGAAAAGTSMLARRAGVPWTPNMGVTATGPYGMTNAWLTALVAKSAQSAGRAAYNSPGRYRDVQEIADEYEPIPPLEQMQFGPLKKAKRMRQGPRGSGGGRR